MSLPIPDEYIALLSSPRALSKEQFIAIKFANCEVGSRQRVPYLFENVNSDFSLISIVVVESVDPTIYNTEPP